MIQIDALPVIGTISKSNAVLQKVLISFGYDIGAPDGIFGVKTEGGVKTFQKTHGLTPDGIVGPKTLALLGLTVAPINPVTGKTPITKDLVGRKDRHIHPTLRLLLEAKVFPDGKIPNSFFEKNLRECFVDVAYALESLAIREVGGNNHGEMVGLVQAIIGSYTPNGNGDAWCLSDAQVIVAFLEDYFQVESPVPATEGCLDLADQAKKIPGLTTTVCEVATIAISEHGNLGKGHAMSVLEVLDGGKMKTLEGNTSDQNISDGDGQYFRTRDQHKNGDLHVLCFVRMYPNNTLPGGV